MKLTKVFFSIMLTIVFLIGSIVLPRPVLAAKHSTIQNGSFYYIQHVSSKKYLDIKDENKANGARLQIWQKYAKHQNQVFKLQKVGNYWKIIAHHSNRVIEVRNSSKDNSAEVGQWDYVGIACQQWEIKYNSDGTISFKNRNSGKYLDVQGNKNKNGTKVNQYKSNGGAAQKFKLIKLDDKDIFNAKREIKIKNSDIKNWTQYSIFSNTFNVTGYAKKINNSYYHPTIGQKYLVRIEYIDAETVHNMLVRKGLNKSNFEAIWEVLKGEGKEEAAAYVLKEKLKYDVPGIGIAFGVLEVLATSQSDKEWNKFAKTTKSGKGIVKKTYIKIVKNRIWGPLNNGTTAYGWKYYVDKAKEYSYSVWNGNGGVVNPSTMNNEWTVTFK